MRAKPTSFVTRVGGRRSVVDVAEKAPGLFSVRIDGVEHRVDSVELRPGNFFLLIDNRPVAAEVSCNKESYTVDLGGRRLVVEIGQAGAGSTDQPALGASAGRKEIRALMPGRVVAILAAPGEEVRKGAGLLVLEAMKMENEVTAPAPGKVIDVRVESGQTVETGQVLAVME